MVAGPGGDIMSDKPPDYTDTTTRDTRPGAACWRPEARGGPRPSWRPSSRSWPAWGTASTAGTGSTVPSRAWGAWAT